MLKKTLLPHQAGQSNNEEFAATQIPAAIHHTFKTSTPGFAGMAVNTGELLELVCFEIEDNRDLLLKAMKDAPFTLKLELVQVLNIAPALGKFGVKDRIHDIPTNSSVGFINYRKADVSSVLRAVLSPLYELREPIIKAVAKRDAAFDRGKVKVLELLCIAETLAYVNGEFDVPPNTPYAMNPTKIQKLYWEALMRAELADLEWLDEMRPDELTWTRGKLPS
jgi:hypothetical protein